MTEQSSNTTSNFNVAFNTSTDYKPLELYCIQDRKTGKFMPPFFCCNEEDAIRQCKQIVNYSPSLINKFPQDYALYFCGCFDEYHGCISASNSIIDGFIAYLDEYVTDDTVKYDDLKKDISEKSSMVVNNLAHLSSLSDTVSDKIAEVSKLICKVEKSMPLIEPLLPVIEKLDFGKPAKTTLIIDHDNKTFKFKAFDEPSEKKNIISKLFN